MHDPYDFTNIVKLKSKPKKHKKVFIILLFALLSLASGIAYFLAPTIEAQQRAARFKPDQAISQMINDLKLTSAGKVILLSAQPDIIDPQDFGQKCPSSDDTVELGCYIPKEHKIYIRKTFHAELDPLQRVTLAHEMLHVAYDALYPWEKPELAAQLTKRYSSSANDDLKSRISTYSKSEPGQQNNELHSILGTELNDLGPYLDKYYRKYFSDRSEVVANNEKYLSALGVISSRLNLEKIKLDLMAQDIHKVNRTLVLHKNLWQFDSNRLPTYVGLDALYNATLMETNMYAVLVAADTSAYNTRIADYNTLVVTYNRDLTDAQAISSDFNGYKSLQNYLAQ